MNYQSLWDELTIDPAGIGYATPENSDNDIANTSLVNDENQSVARESISGTELWENTDLTEYKALTTAERQAYDVLISLTTIDIRQGTNSRLALASLFPSNSTTRGRLIALSQSTVATSRAKILGLGKVYSYDIETARNRYG